MPPVYPTRRPRRRRLAALLAYNGSGFRGFQRQPNQRTVEGALLKALVACGYGEGLGFASRTDAGVHAVGQVVAFKVPESAEPQQVELALNEQLPDDVTLSRVVWAPSRFHPRWSALGKRYVYRLPANAIDEDKLARALGELRDAPLLDGFTAAGAPPRPAPPLDHLTLERDGGQFVLTFEGLAFRRYGIRHMVGCAIGQAQGELPEGSCAQTALLAPPYRGLRADPGGLTLIEVFYPEALHPFSTK